ncbi:hypothetical protein [Williamsia serinedens]|uniref:Integral membrane protein n=1 Tax=Williamsia serinedens TaxID=391736 RepID=A0ABT1GW87_9NOCA|nr:hypothetical protein [Williamsia serinedens]MCP2159245.1 hypothetical protein [Williamsia serinedens]
MTVTVVCLAVCAAVAVLSTLPHGRFLRTAAVVVATVTLATAAVAAAVVSPAEGSTRGVVVTLVVVIAAFGGVGLVPLVFDLVEVDHRDHRPAEEPGAAATDDDTTALRSRPLRGGRVIGVLERVAVVGALVAGWPEGIAVVLAVKGLARYPEIRDQHAGEQFIIGTFASVLWAVAAAGVARLALT